MPEDFFSSDSKGLSLVASPEEALTTRSDDGDNEFTIHRDELRPRNMQQLRRNGPKTDLRNNLHPYVQTLSWSNLESCIALENAVFPEQERCLREKFIYRLKTCPELCLGLFSTISDPEDPSKVPTYHSALVPDSTKPNRKAVLLAMVISTKTVAPSMTDECMEYPPDYQHSPPASADPRGHHEYGRTIAIQTLGVLPEYQGCGLGRICMKSYEQRIEASGIADRIALLAHDHLVKMYEGMGFENKGKSDVIFGGGGWNSLIYEFPEHASGSLTS